MKKPCLLFAAAGLCAAAAAAPLSVQEWPAQKLRGYGEVSARAETAECFSRLEIRCESAEKAGIVHAKFVSDLHVLGGVRDETRMVGGLAVPVIVVPEQGQVSAFRSGRTVVIVASTSEAGWQESLTPLKKALAHAALAAPHQVPMFLDAWDRYGFRFYYRPWETPKGQKWSGYPVLGEFDFAKREDHRGFVFWSETANVDNAVGLDNDLWWD